MISRSFRLFLLWDVFYMCARIIAKATCGRFVVLILKKKQRWNVSPSMHTSEQESLACSFVAVGCTLAPCSTTDYCGRPRELSFARSFFLFIPPFVLDLGWNLLAIAAMSILAASQPVSQLTTKSAAMGGRQTDRHTDEHTHTHTRKFFFLSPTCKRTSFPARNIHKHFQ